MVAIGLGVSSMGVPGAGVIEDPIGFGVSSVEGGLPGVEVFGFSDVDGDIGLGVSWMGVPGVRVDSSVEDGLLGVEVLGVSAEGVGIGVWFGSDGVETFPVLIMGVVVGGFSITFIFSSILSIFFLFVTILNCTLYFC